MPIQVMLPSGRVTTVDTDDPKVAAATARAFVQRDAYESKRAHMAGHPVGSAIEGGLETAMRGIPFLTEAQAAIGTPFDMAADALTGGKPHAGKSWTRQRALQQATVDDFKTNHPILSGMTTGATMGAPIAAALMSGGASEIPEMATQGPKVAKGVADFLKPALTRTARRATAGGTTGAVYGASQPGTLEERGQSAVRGGEIGAVIGAAAPPVLDVVGGAAVKTAGKVGTTLARAANKTSGGALLDANQTAANRLTEALKADGATPDLIRQAMNGFLRNGAADPSLIDVASRLPSGGSNTLALVRGAAAKGSGRGVAQTYGKQVSEDLQGRAIDHTRGLTPDTRSADQVKAGLKTARKERAAEQYPAAYPQAVDTAPLMDAVSGNAGKVAIKGAAKLADAGRMAPESDELASILKAANPPPPAPLPAGTDGLGADAQAQIREKLGLDAPQLPPQTRLGTLDNIKQAFAKMAKAAAARPGQERLATYYGDRAREIDDHLADISPDYAIARDNYFHGSDRMAGVDLGKTALTAHPDDYAAELEKLKGHVSGEGPSPAQGDAGIGYRQALTDAIGAPAEGSTGTLNKVSTSTNQGRNLEATFGPDQASTYRAGLKDLTDQLRNARSIDPGTASPTAQRLADMGLVEPKDAMPIHSSSLRIILGAINKIRAGATLTDEERAIITKMGTARRPDVTALDLADPKRPPAPQSLDDLRAYMAAYGTGQDDGQKRATTP